MTSWVWMKGVSTPLADAAVDPTHDGDQRPLVKDLIAKHRAAIDKLAADEELQKDNLYDPTKHDDLWILRFVLTHKKKHKAALKAMKHTLQFRKERGLDDTDIRFHPPGHPSALCPEMNEMMKYADPDTFLWCLPQGNQGHVVAFVRFKGYDQNALVENVNADHWVPCFVYLAEWAFQWSDYITRTTGRLTKNVRLIDFAGMSMFEVNREVAKRDSEAMRVTEDCYPQLLECVLICHGPAWLQVIWRLLRPFMPRRVVEKADFMHPTSNTKERDRILRHMPLHVLPTRFGGAYEPWPVEFPLPGK